MAMPDVADGNDRRIGTEVKASVKSVAMHGSSPCSGSIVASEGDGMSEITRIATRCPSCGHDTLFIGGGNWLTCGWLECKAPTLINSSNDRYRAVQAERDALQVRVAELESIINELEAERDETDDE